MKPFRDPKKTFIAAAVFAALAVPAAVMQLNGIDGGFLPAAQAQEKGGKQVDKGGTGQGKQGQGAADSGRGIDRVLRAPVTPSAEEDSDRPDWAGVKGGKAGGGTKPGTAGTKKGDLFGDMVILLRDANGVPILTADGLVQVIAFITDSSGNLVPLTDASGNLLVIPYTAEGELATTMTVDGVVYNVAGAEVDLGRLSVGRSPTKVLGHSLTEALDKLTSATLVTVDATGRLVVDGVTIDSPLENLALYELYMTTGALSTVPIPTGFNPASLLAAAADKTGTISVDTVVYMNSILGINTGTSWYDFATYEYDRYATWGDKTTTVLVLQPDGSYVPTVVNLYDTLFSSTNWTDPTAVGGADDFAAAANDYLQVIEFVHDNAVR
jgi:hypothetical protein